LARKREQSFRLSRQKIEIVSKFYLSALDITAQQALFGDGEKVANEIRRRIYAELGVTASVGVSWNKIFAKLGSDLKKPDATTVISRENYKEVAWELPAEDLLYVGRSTKRKLFNFGIRTIGDLARFDPSLLKNSLGKNGQTLWYFANGLDDAPVAKASMRGPSIIKSVGNSTTAPRDLESEEDVRLTLYVLCESVASRMRDYGVLASTVQVTFRDKDLLSYQRQMGLASPTCVSGMLFDAAIKLYRDNHLHGKPLRSIGVRATGLSQNWHVQLSYTDEGKQMQKREELEKTIDALRNRFGHQSVKRAVMLSDDSLTGLDPKSDHTIHPVSYFA